MVDEVVLLGYPVRLGAEQQEHLDAVVREFQLIALSSSPDRSPVPARLLAVVDHVVEAQSAGDGVRDRALLAGRRTVDVRYPLADDGLELMRAWEQVLAEVDSFCRGDDLLVLARSARIAALQRWVTSEFVRQAEGHEPQAWTGPV